MPARHAVVLCALGGLVADAVLAVSLAAAQDEGGFVRLPPVSSLGRRSDRPTESTAGSADSGPATRTAGRVLETLRGVEARLRTTRYQHATRVRERDGLYAWDCSGMAAWILDRAAPRAMSAVLGERPVARDFYRAIARAPVDRPARGWQRLPHIENARPGDVLAWVRPPWFQSTNTGHVAFVLEAPRRVIGLDRAYTVRIADATSLPHQGDSRHAEGEGGYGTGTLLLTVDEAGAPTAYGWYGSESEWVIPTQIAFGRLVR